MSVTTPPGLAILSMKMALVLLLTASSKVDMSSGSAQTTFQPKLLKECSLPLTGTHVVDLVITDLGVFEIDKKGDGGMTLIELADGATLEEIAENTEAAYRVAPGL